MSPEQLSRIIHAVYHAAEDPASWPEFLELLAEEIRSSGVLFLIPDWEHEHVSVGHHSRIDPDAAREYNDYWGSFDVWLNAGEKWMSQVGVVYSGHEIVDESELKKSSFYQGFLSRHDGGHMLAATVMSFPSNAAVLSCNFPIRQGPAPLGAIRLVRLLLPHIQQAIRLHRQLRGYELSESVMDEFIGHLPVGFLLVGDTGCILRMNREAERILQEQDGLSQRQRKLLAHWRPDDQQLQFLQRQALKTTFGNGVAPGGVLAVQRPSGKPSYTVMVSPVDTSGQLFETHRAAVVVLICDPARRPAVQPDLMKKLFGLTKAESLVAVCLMEGKDPAEIAEELHISKHTVRDHLKRLYSKTYTSSRAALVQLLLRSVTSLWEEEARPGTLPT